MSITVEWELVPGQPCCCGKPDHAWPDQWKWVARADGNMVTGDTPEEATEGLQLFIDCRAEGRFPTAEEMLSGKLNKKKEAKNE